MSNFQKKVLSALATGAVLLSSVSPVLADQTLVISGNGADSTSTVVTTTTTTNTVQQSNTADVTNHVDSNSSTGGNTASQNTGGSTGIQTGDATTKATVTNMLNSNTANVECCGADSTTVKVTGNGTDTTNTAVVTQASTNNIVQDNDAHVDNHVDADATSGDNHANQNTGGTTTIRTGNAESDVHVSTEANRNVASVGGTGGSASAGSVDVQVADNGADSTNTVTLALTKENLAWQENSACIHNDVDADAKTGKNSADQNTGGDTYILTGNAKAKVTVANDVNANFANFTCDSCGMDVLAKVAGNGTDTKNTIVATLAGENSVYQGGEKNGNSAHLYNDVDADPSSGYNHAGQNTGPAEIDPVAVVTGDATSIMSVSNTANRNVYGAVPEEETWPTPTIPGTNLNVNVTFNLGDMLHSLGLI